jgi:hypothetical protein
MKDLGKKRTPISELEGKDIEAYVLGFSPKLELRSERKMRR